MPKDSPEIVVDADDPTRERTCLRCGCTEEKAVPVACAWACQSVDLCTGCVRADEAAMIDDMVRLEAALMHIGEVLDEWTVVLLQRLRAELREKGRR